MQTHNDKMRSVYANPQRQNEKCLCKPTTTKREVFMQTHNDKMRSVYANPQRQNEKCLCKPTTTK